MASQDPTHNHTLSIFRACRARPIGAYGEHELARPMHHMSRRIADFPHLNGELTMKSRSTDRSAAPSGNPFLATYPVFWGRRGMVVSAYAEAPATEDG